jgi:hypothetical protein
VAKLRFLLLALLVPELALAQFGITHGTVVVVNKTDDKLIMAADSMAIHSFGIPDNSYCKISTFSHQIVFAGIGCQGYVNTGSSDRAATWSAKDILRRVVGSEPKGPAGIRHIQNISESWAALVLVNLEIEYLAHPQDVIKMAEEQKGSLSGGIFAEARDGEIYMRVAVVRFNQNLLSPQSLIFGDIGDCWTCGQKEGGKICAEGQPAVAAEFCTESSERAKGQEGRLTYGSTLLSLGWDKYSLLALRLADLTSAYDRSRTVGGNIDVLELDKNGHIRWLARKGNCPDSDN